jgi:hypothetical protein
VPRDALDVLRVLHQDGHALKVGVRMHCSARVRMFVSSPPKASHTRGRRTLPDPDALVAAAAREERAARRVRDALALRLVALEQARALPLPAPHHTASFSFALVHVHVAVIVVAIAAALLPDPDVRVEARGRERLPGRRPREPAHRLGVARWDRRNVLELGRDLLAVRAVRAARAAARVGVHPDGAVRGAGGEKRRARVPRDVPRPVVVPCPLRGPVLGLRKGGGWRGERRRTSELGDGGDGMRVF